MVAIVDGVALEGPMVPVSWNDVLPAIFTRQDGSSPIYHRHAGASIRFEI